MQNSCKTSSHCPEQNSSFYFVEKAIDFPFVLHLYSYSVYSWAVTGLPKAALQTSCSLTISVVIILLSGGDNLKCPRSSEMQGRQQELLTFFFFNVAFSMPENGTAMNLHLGLPSLDNHRKTQSNKVPSIQPLSRELCQLARDNNPDSMKTKLEPWKQSRHLSSGTMGGSPSRGTQCKSPCRCDITFKLFKLLSQLQPVLKKQKKTDFFKSSCYLFLFFQLTNSLV